MLNRFWAGWKAFGRLLGNLLARVVLTVFYFTVFVPFGMIVSLFSDQLAIGDIPEKLWQSRETPIETVESAQRQG